MPDNETKEKSEVGINQMYALEEQLAQLRDDLSIRDEIIVMLRLTLDTEIEHRREVEATYQLAVHEAVIATSERNLARHSLDECRKKGDDKTAIISQLCSEIDRYDAICTGIRNELTVAGISGLTEDRLNIIPLFKRMTQLVTKFNFAQKRVASARTVIVKCAEADAIYGIQPPPYITEWLAEEEK
ncbi:MAG: hypothetical protein IMZ52_00300 [Actinobacteria bacterium]|nr:hypothetical protein [Actinomycetota bacterium]